MGELGLCRIVLDLGVAGDGVTCDKPGDGGEGVDMRSQVRQTSKAETVRTSFLGGVHRTTTTTKARVAPSEKKIRSEALIGVDVVSFVPSDSSPSSSPDDAQKWNYWFKKVSTFKAGGNP